MLFFVVIGVLSMQYFRKEKQMEHKGAKSHFFYFSLFCTLLMIIAAFRMVRRLGYGAIGGTDAPNYIHLFEICNNSAWMNWTWLQHNDILFLYMNKLVRFFTGDYHVWFCFLYGFIAVSFVLFLKTFLLKKVEYIPCVLLIFIYWVGFNTIRSTTAYAFLMLALVLIFCKRTYVGICFAVATLFVHKISFIYVGFIPFWLIFEKRDLNRKTIILMIVATSVFGIMVRSFFLAHFADADLGGAYQSYAKHAIGRSFFDNYWKISFEQIVLAGAIFLLRKRMTLFSMQLDNVDKNRLRALYLMCAYDFMMIPMCFFMGAWRGYEMFYLPRIAMWCVVLQLVKICYFSHNKCHFRTLCLICFIAWMIFRFRAIWQDAYLMPYVFEPLFNLL